MVTCNFEMCDCIQFATNGDNGGPKFVTFTLLNVRSNCRWREVWVKVFSLWMALKNIIMQWLFVGRVWGKRRRRIYSLTNRWCSFLKLLLFTWNALISFFYVMCICVCTSAVPRGRFFELSVVYVCACACIYRVYGAYFTASICIYACVFLRVRVPKA